MQLYRKRFQELTTEELYGILKLRVDVFVVEQNCRYREYVDVMPEDGTVHCHCPECTATYAAAKDPKLLPGGSPLLTEET